MQLEGFLNVIVFLFLTDQSFQATVLAAEINFNALPDFECIKIVKNIYR